MIPSPYFDKTELQKFSEIKNFQKLKFSELAFVMSECYNAVIDQLIVGKTFAMAKEKPIIELKELPENYVPQYSAAMPLWSQQISAELMNSAQFKGSPGFEPGPEQAAQVEKMTALGMAPTDIAAILRIETKLLKKYYDYELETAGARVNNAVAKIALQMALSGASPDMTKFWLTRRAGWKETKVTEITGSGGGPVQFAEVKQRMIDQIEAEIVDAEVIEEKDNDAS